MKVSGEHTYQRKGSFQVAEQRLREKISPTWSGLKINPKGLNAILTAKRDNLVKQTSGSNKDQLFLRRQQMRWLLNEKPLIIIRGNPVISKSLIHKANTIGPIKIVRLENENS